MFGVAVIEVVIPQKEMKSSCYSNHFFNKGRNLFVTEPGNERGRRKNKKKQKSESEGRQRTREREGLWKRRLGFYVLKKQEPTLGGLTH